LLTGLALIWPGFAQMHKVAKPQQVVRAVGVYEWTGDFTKPNASRLIPVSLYIDGGFQDAGIYIARPVPFALLSGNVYELESAGIGRGMLDLVYARHLQATDATGDLAYDDGWFGYGKVQPLAVPRHAATLKPSKNLAVLQSSVKDTAAKSTASGSSATASADDPDRPVMKRRDNSSASSGTGSTSADGSTTPADDPDRPVMKRRDNSDASTGTASANDSTPAADPDRPTMKRDSSSASSTSTADTSSTPAADADRPTLKRRTPEEARKAKDANDGPSALGYESLNNDPNRPTLHYGKPTHALTETDLPKLTGMPEDLHQMVAVSDAANRDPHPFALAWQDAAARTAILEKMEALARVQIASYGKQHSGTRVGNSSTATANVKKVSAIHSHHIAAKSTPQPAIALMEEKLEAYTLSYGGDPTYIYSAHTDGTGSLLRYVTIVAQTDSLGQFKPAIQSVTDAAHLDDTPRMRFVDVVDAEASNRASLLFELRGQHARQFGLYRVIAAHSEQIFLTGTTQ
jgi:hypothetical protein